MSSGSSPLAIEQMLGLYGQDGYVVLVVDPQIGEVDAYGPFDGLEATVTADRLRADLDASGLPDVVVGVSRWHRQEAPSGPDPACRPRRPR